MKDFFSSMDWQDWIRGIWAAIVGGGANAVVAAIGVTISDPAHFNMANAAFYKTVGSVFATGALIAFVLYLKQNPVPRLVSKTVTTVTVEKAES